MVYRPRDICSAAFQNDIQRLRLLATQGVPGGIIDNEEEPLEEFEEAAIDADSEFIRICTQYDIMANDEIDIMNDDEFDTDEDEDDEAQQGDLALYRNIVRRQLREAALALKINAPGLLHFGSSPVSEIPYGIFFSCQEKGKGTNSPEAGSAVLSPKVTDLDENIYLKVQWKPSKRSPFKAPPLHWAVLGCAHDAIRFLVENGADAKQEIEFTLNLLESKATDSLGEKLSSAVSPINHALCNYTLRGLTPDSIAIANNLCKTLNVLREAVEVRCQVRERRNAEKQLIECRLEQRKAKREKRRLEREQRRIQLEERELNSDEDSMHN